jgi:hypothetical protein
MKRLALIVAVAVASGSGEVFAADDAPGTPTAAAQISNEALMNKFQAMEKRIQALEAELKRKRASSPTSPTSPAKLRNGPDYAASKDSAKPASTADRTDNNTEPGAFDRLYSRDIPNPTWAAYVTDSGTDPGPSITGNKPASAAGGSDNGTDPSVFAKRVILYNDYNRLAGGVDINVTYLDLFYPMLKDDRGVERGLFRVEMPFVNAENLGSLLVPAVGANIPKDVSGIGDVQFRFLTLPWYNDSQTLKLIAGVDFYVPSAQGELLAVPQSNAVITASLGTGKYRVEPIVALVWKPAPNMLFAPAYEQNISFAGDPERPPINVGAWKFFFMYAWPTGTYVLPELQIVHSYINYNLTAPPLAPGTTLKTDVFFRPEVGQVLNKDGTTIYIKPGIGLNDPGTLNRQWGIEGGIRMMW